MFNTNNVSFSLEKDIKATYKTNHKIFPTLILEFKNFLSKDKCEKISNKLLQLEPKKHEAFGGDALSTHRDFDSDAITTIQTIDGLYYIREKIEWALSEYQQEYGMAPVKLTNSWFNVQQPGSTLYNHVHSLSVISGALYTNVDKDSSRLVFDNPNKMVQYCLSTSRETEFNDEHYEISPRVGSLFLFPSWLYHGSNKDVNNTPNRLVVSFNSFYKDNNFLQHF